MFTPVQMIPVRQIPTADTLLFDNTSGRNHIIDSITVTNTTATAAYFNLAIVTAAATALDAAGAGANTSIWTKYLATGEAYNCPELVGKMVPAGGGIRTTCGTADTFTVIANGRQIT